MSRRDVVAPLAPVIIEKLVRAALEEDLGEAGDLTTEALVRGQDRLKTAIVARESGVLCGVDFARTAFHLMSDQLKITINRQNGAALSPGDAVIELEGPARAILSAERVALNWLMRLSGISSLTGRYVDAVRGTRARIVCTRKTTPGLRAAEKFAVRIGGGFNHRFGLHDGILIKDNHIAACGGVRQAVERAIAHAGHMVRIEVEADTLDQARDAVAHGAHAILLDNMSKEQVAEAVSALGEVATLEVSGGVTLDTVRGLAETGVDVISIGGLTHRFHWLDMGMDVI